MQGYRIETLTFPQSIDCLDVSYVLTLDDSPRRASHVNVQESPRRSQYRVP